MKRGLAVLLAAFAPVSWGSNVVASRFLVRQGLDPTALTAVRWLIAAVLMLVYARVRGYKVPLSARLALMGVLGITVFSNMLYFAVRYAPAALVGLVFGLLPVATMIVARLYGVEELDPWTLGAAGLGFLGVALIEAAGLESGGTEWIGVAIALASLFVWAVYTVESKKFTARIHPMEALVGSTLASVPFNFLAAAGSLSTVRVLLDPFNAAVLLYLAAVPGFAAYLAWFYAVRELGPTFTSLFVDLLPVSATVLAILLLGETLRGLQAVGAALVLASLALAARRQLQLARAAEALASSSPEGGVD